MPDKMLEADPAVPPGAETISDDWKSAVGSVDTSPPPPPVGEPQPYYRMFCHSCVGFSWPKRYVHSEAEADAAQHARENEGHATEVQ